MTRVLRLLTLFVSFAALQLSLVSGGPGCPMPDPSAPARSAMAGMDMADMDMAGMDMAGMDMGRATLTSSDASVAAQPAPCDESTAPVTCPTMAPCVFAALPRIAERGTTSTIPPVRPIALRALMPPSTSAAPELPPPRV